MSDSTRDGVPAPQLVTLLAEEVHVGTRLVEGEGVRIRVLTEHEEVPTHVTLTSERVEVIRVPIGRVVDVAPATREEAGVTIIPVMTETVITRVQLVLKEELHVRRITEQNEHRAVVPLRRQRAEIEVLPAGPHAAGANDKNQRSD